MPLSACKHTRPPLDVHIGPCGTASDAGDCRAGSKGSWPLTAREASSWEAAAAACERRCLACERCRFISMSTHWRDCSWFHSCDLGALRHDVFGFLSTAVNSTPPLRQCSKRHGKRHGRGARLLRLRVMALRRQVAATPARRVPIRAEDVARLSKSFASEAAGAEMVPALPAPEVATSPPLDAAAARPLAWSYPAVFWPDELEAGPCYRIPSVVQTRVGSLVAFAEARQGRWWKAASALLSSSASAAWKACGGLGRRASAG